MESHPSAREWAVTAFAIQSCGTILHQCYPISNTLFPSSLINTLLHKFTLSSPSRSPPSSVASAVGPSVTTSSPAFSLVKLVFFFGIYLFEFSVAEITFKSMCILNAKLTK
jgi:hypothetical protein